MSDPPHDDYEGRLDRLRKAAQEEGVWHRNGGNENPPGDNARRETEELIALGAKLRREVEIGLLEKSDRERSEGGEVGSKEVIAALRRRVDLAGAVKRGLVQVPILLPWEPAKTPMGELAERFVRRDVTGEVVTLLKPTSPAKWDHDIRWEWEINVPSPQPNGTISTRCSTGPFRPKGPLTELEEAFGQADLRLLDMAPDALFLDPEDHPGRPPKEEP